MRKLDEALNYLRSEDWENLHTLVQNDQSKVAAWIHGHLHRMEGDMANARLLVRTCRQGSGDR